MGSAGNARALDQGTQVRNRAVTTNSYRLYGVIRGVYWGETLWVQRAAVPVKIFQGRNKVGQKSRKPSAGAGFQAYKRCLLLSGNEYFQK